MKISCEHGYYSFWPQKEEDLFLFTNYLGITLVKKDDYYTYPLLADLPNYVILPSLYGLFPSDKTFEGTPKEIMKELGLVYNIATGTLVKKEAITISGDLIKLARNWMSERSMIQSGMILGSGRLLSYDGVFNFDLRKTIVRYFE